MLTHQLKSYYAVTRHWAAMFLLLCCSQQTLAYGTILNDIDFRGYDLHKFLNVESALKCNYACAGTRNCKSYTWNQEDHNCYTKSKIPPIDVLSSNRDAVSGAVQTSYNRIWCLALEKKRRIWLI